MRLHAKGHRPEERIKIARIDILVDGDHHLAGRRIISDHAMQRLPDMRLVDLFHFDYANLPHGDAVKSDFDNAGNIALISKESQIISLRRNLAHDARLARRHLADDRRQDRVLTVGDAFHFEEWIEQALGDVTGRFAEGRFRLYELRRDFALDHDLGVGRHQHVVGLALHDLDRSTGKPAGNVELAHAERNARRRRVSDTGRRADHQRGLERDTALLAFAPMVSTVVARTEKHARSCRAFDMAAVVADVDDAGLRVLGEPVRRRGKRRAVVAWSRNWNWKFSETAFLQQVRSRVNDFMHRRIIDDARRYRIRLRLIPAVDDLLRFALKPEAVNLSRRRQCADDDRNIVLASLRIDHVSKHKCAALLFRKPAKLPAHQRHQFGIFVDLLVDLDQQTRLVQRRNVFSQVFEITHTKRSLIYSS